MDSFAVAVSMCLQYGVPLRVLVNKFSHSRFEPSGYTTNKEIPIAKSLMDYIFRWFDLKFHPNGDNGHFGKVAESPAHEAHVPSLPLTSGHETGTEKKSSLNLNLPLTIPVARPRGNDGNGYNGNGHNGHANGNGAHAGDLERGIVQMQSDAPPCGDCGTLMVRSGACYRCPDCGTTSGCG